MNAVGSRLSGGSTPVWASGALLVVLIAAGTLLLVRTIGTGGEDQDSARARGTPDVRMERAVMRQFGTDGSLDFALESPEIRFFRDEGRACSVRPPLTRSPRTMPGTCSLHSSRRPRTGRRVPKPGSSGLAHFVHRGSSR